MSITIKPLQSLSPRSPETPAHWVGNPPTHFQNPWTSFVKNNLLAVLKVRFGNNRNFVPVPESRDELVGVRNPDWGRGQPGWESGLKATWLGHAGFLVETPCASNLDDPASNVLSDSSAEEEVEGQEKGKGTEARGIRILFDPVFSDRTSPFSFLGPKRYTPAPCQISELPDIDVIAISHNHYDHLDVHTITTIHAQQATRGKPLHFIAGLGNKPWFLSSVPGLTASEVTECDWWDQLHVSVKGVGEATLTCTPTQHFSSRTPFDAGKTLWCSYHVSCPSRSGVGNKSLYFAGDTAYQDLSTASPCPAFSTIGERLGPVDLALVPIGLFMPETFMSSVHASPAQSLKIAQEVKAKRTLGMHWGTFRGGLSAQYEDVRVPPREWRRVCEEEGVWGDGVHGGEGGKKEGCGLIDVGETAIV